MPRYEQPIIILHGGLTCVDGIGEDCFNLGPYFGPGYFVALSHQFRVFLALKVPLSAELSEGWMDNMSAYG